MNFLQFIWEATSEDSLSSPSNHINKLKEEMKERKKIEKKKFGKRKSLIIKNTLSNSFNKGMYLFNVCEIIKYLFSFKKNKLIKYIFK